MTEYVNHFQKRCRERGITKTDVDKLNKGLKWAKENERYDLIEEVISDDDAAFYRFKCQDGIFYALFKPCTTWPITVYDKAMMDRMKSMKRKPKAKRRSTRKHWQQYRGT